MKKNLATSLLAGTLVLAQAAPAFATADTTGHWAQDALNTWQNYGVIKGDENGNLMPDSGITRGEMAVMLDRVMAYQLKSQNAFSDLDQSWYTDAILGANAAGIIMGMGDGTVQPGASITRQETAVMFARVLNLDTQSAPDAGFLDQASIPDWAVGSVNAMAAAGYMQGSNGMFRPADTITRAEVVTILDNIFNANYNTSGEYTGDVDGSAVISADNVTLKDMHITGDLIVAEGVGEGHVELDNVTVDGRLLVRGGGANSIVIKGDSKITQVIVARQEGKVRVAVEDSAQVSVVVVEEGTDNVKLEGTLGTVSIEGSGAAVEIAGKVDTVDVTESADNTSVTVSKDATVSTLTTSAENATLTVAGKVEAVTVTESAEGTAVKTESGAKIDSVTTAGSNTTVEGNGTVSKVEAAEGSTGTTVTTNGTKVENNSAESVTTGNGSIDAGESGTTKPSTGGSSSGGGTVHTHSYVDGVCSCGSYDSAWAQVNSVESWNAAVEAGKNIVLTDSFTADAQLALSAALTVNGNGKTITSTNINNETGKSAGILVTASGAAIKNLTVSGPNNTATTWDNGEYGIMVYNATNVTLENVTVTAANAGIQVNSSEVTLSGTITVSDNEWGGIEVCKGSGLDNSGTLNINGAAVVCSDTDVPAIWIDGTTAEAGVVIGADSLYTSNTGSQIYYFTAVPATAQARIGQTLYASLDDALSALKTDDTLTLHASSTISPSTLQTAVTGKNVTIDVNGNELTVSGANASVVLEKSGDASTALTIKNGTLNLNNNTGANAAINIKTDSSIVLKDLTVNSTATVLYPQGDAASVTVDNCDITTSGAYAIATNSATVDNYNVVISVSGGSITMNAADNDSTALCLNVAGTMNVTGTVITGQRQAVIVRAGTATFTGCTISSNSSPLSWVNESMYTGTWGSGNEVPYGALIVGNQTASTYAADANVTLTDCEISATGTEVITGTVEKLGENVSISGLTVTGEETAVTEAI